MKKLKEESDDGGHTTVLEAAGNALNIVSMTGIFIRIIVNFNAKLAVFFSESIL